MLQTYATEDQHAGFDDREQGLNLARLFGILRKRILYLIVPFLLVLLSGSTLTAIQRPIYRAEGKILIESQEIPADLVRPTVSSAASERIQVIQQRIMTRENLLGIINKYGLFPSQQKWMSASQLLDLMRERTEIKLIDATSATRRDNTIAFTVGFEYEVPDITMKVANEYVTLILAEDARTRTNRAAETTKFLAREVARLQGELGAGEAQIAAAKQRKLDSERQQLQSGSAGSLVGGNPLAQQLVALKADLLQKAAVYSSEHPAVKALKQRIAALEKTIAETPAAADSASAAGADDIDKFGVDALTKQKETVEKSLEDATKKLTAARLGESLERDQQSERLEVIEQPTMPQKPVRPNRTKLLTLTLIAAMMAGFGGVFAIESIDRTIRGSEELSGIFDTHMVVAIPYIATQKEEVRKRNVKRLLVGSFVIISLAGFGVALYLDLIPTDLSWVDTSLFDRFRSLAK
jgi:uncharacterized protein involved in exopolysaccharide biosynthesis